MCCTRKNQRLGRRGCLLQLIYQKLRWVENAESGGFFEQGTRRKNTIQDTKDTTDQQSHAPLQ